MAALAVAWWARMERPLLREARQAAEAARSQAAEPLAQAVTATRLPEALVRAARVAQETELAVAVAAAIMAAEVVVDAFTALGEEEAPVTPPASPDTNLEMEKS